MGIADSFGVRLVAVGKAVQKFQNIIWGDFINLGITEVLAETIYDRSVGPYGIFFSNG